MSKKPTNLPSLAKKANEEHEAALGCAHAALDHAMEAGRLLAEAKAQVAHGEWLPWIEEHFSGSARTARAYMRLNENRAEVEANRQRVANLGVRDALAYLAEPAEPEPDEEPPEEPSEGGDGDEVDPATVPLGDDELNTPEAIADAEGLPEPTPEEIERGEAEAARAKAHTGDDKKPEVPTDPYGTPLEPAVAEAFARKAELTGLMHRISKVKTDVLKACEDGDPLYAPILPARIKADLENARWQIAACIPHAACPHCRQIGCDVCQGRGYVSEEVYKRYQDAQAAGRTPDPEAFRPQAEPEPAEPEADDDGDDDDQAPCAFCGQASWFVFECKKCGTETAVCEACEDQSKAELCPDCLEAKSE